MRNIPALCPDILQLSDRHPLFDMQLNVVTPLFGGGVNPGEVDVGRAVNAKTVRGHLRFWWRACNAHRFTTSTDLFAAETEIWGSCDTPSAVDVTVIARDVTQSRYTELSNLGNRNQRGIVKYVTFPYRSAEPDYISFCSFKMVIYKIRSLSDEALLQIKGAIWAWITFGGVGSRTRRGCGSLFSKDPVFQPTTDVMGWIRDGLTTYAGQRSSCLLTPQLAQASVLLDCTREDHKFAWLDANAVMYKMRQGGGIARYDGDQGKSLWPEADTIRQSHRDRNVIPVKGVDSPFPRADLGLPIVYEFFTDHGRTPKQMLQGADKEHGRTRMASPIIMKALSVSENQSVPIILVLKTPHPWDVGAPELEVSLGGAEYKVKKEHIGPGSRGISPMNGHSSAREALVEYAKSSCGFTEVRL